MADPRIKELAYDVLAISLTRDIFQGRGPTQSLLGEDAVSRNLRGPILDNLQPSVTAYKPTMRQRLASGAQRAMEAVGMRRPQARSVSQGIFGGPSSPLPAELGVADVVPFLGTAMQTQEAARSLGRAGQLTEQGEYGQAAIETGMGILGMVPGAAGTVQMARPILRDLSSTPPIGAVRIDQAVPPKADVVSPIEQARQISKQPQFRDAFTTSDPYVYHLSDNKNIESFVSKGIKASKKGMSGPGVYLARTPEETQYHSTLDTGTLYRIDKEKLIKDYGLYHYKDNPSGKIQFDETTGEILVDAKNIPSDYIEVKIGTSYTPLQEFIKVATPTILAFEPTMSRSQSVETMEKNEEQQFQNWIRSTGWFKEFVKEFGEEPDVNIPEYDYRAAWKAGITPERDPYDQNRYHWPSSDPSGKMLKSQEHPTAWKEFFMRDTGINPDALGLKTKEEAEAYLQGLK